MKQTESESETPLPMHLDCAMCGANESFVIDNHDPSVGYCFAEKTAWRVYDRSRGAEIGSNYTVEDAERDALMPPPVIHWNIERKGKRGPSMNYIRADIADERVRESVKEFRAALVEAVRGQGQRWANDNHLSPASAAMFVAELITTFELEK